VSSSDLSSRRLEHLQGDHRKLRGCVPPVMTLATQAVAEGRYRSETEEFPRPGNRTGGVVRSRGGAVVLRLVNCVPTWSSGITEFTGFISAGSG
jgi:hypothetical protein